MATHVTDLTVEAAMARLEEGNWRYMGATAGIGDVSQEARARTARDGQTPWAVVVACSDSRVIPESIFSVGIGELFVVRTAGNTIDGPQLGSIEYAVAHLGVPLVVVMGHTGCGAVGTALSHEPVGGPLKDIIDAITNAIGDEGDPLEATKLNVLRGVETIRASVPAAQVVGAVYRTDSGRVDFLP